MSTHQNARARSRHILLVAFVLVLSGCAGQPEQTEVAGSWGGRSIGAPPAPKPGMRQAMITRALREWDYFGNQVVVLEGATESIPNVGIWEDEDSARSNRVNLYWRAVGKPNLSGNDCRQPWSAAFVSWVMQSAGVPQSQFTPTSAHWVYLSGIVDAASTSGRYFVPRRIVDYSPRPGDIICASRSGSRPGTANGYTYPELLRGANTHCDIVVAKNGQTLESVGGNVRNSVSKSVLQLDSGGHLQPVKRRPWFLILENRL